MSEPAQKLKNKLLMINSFLKSHIIVVVSVKAAM